MANRKKPTHLKLLQGSRVNKKKAAKEPKPNGDLFKAPDHLTESQKAEWTYFIANSPRGLLKKLDRSTFEKYIISIDLYHQALMAVNKSGIIVKSPVKGEPMQNPYLAVLNKQALISVKLAAELGFTPSSRSRISIEPPSGSDDDDFEEFS